MKILIKAAKIISKGSEHNNKIRDILIENGKIKNIKANITAKGAKEIKIKNLHVSPGWMDMQVHFQDPGHEYKEDLNSGMKAAAAGGYTAVALMPSTNPPIHSKSEVEYIINKTQAAAINVYPLGTLSHNHEGKEISEMYDMHLSGAVAFTDDKKPINDAGLLLRALLYAKNFNALIVTHCDDKGISREGKMNEGEVSTRIGLKGIPALAEELMLSRNIEIAAYSEAKIHIPSVSTAKSVELIRQAKKQGIKITAGVNAHHLALNDTALENFDTNYKVNPPLRGKKDIEALKKGLLDGTIDVITSDHRPEDIEGKKVEFDYAKSGMLGIQTAFALSNANKGKLSLDALIDKISIQPRKILQLPIPEIKEGSDANLTLFDPDLKWVLQEKELFSKSKNTPLIGMQLIGKALGIINKGKYIN